MLRKGHNVVALDWHVPACCDVEHRDGRCNHLTSSCRQSYAPCNQQNQEAGTCSKSNAQPRTMRVSAACSSPLRHATTPAPAPYAHTSREAAAGGSWCAQVHCSDACWQGAGCAAAPLGVGAWVFSMASVTASYL